MNGIKSTFVWTTANIFHLYCIKNFHSAICTVKKCLDGTCILPNFWLGKDIEKKVLEYFYKKLCTKIPKRVDSFAISPEIINNYIQTLKCLNSELDNFAVLHEIKLSGHLHQPTHFQPFSCNMLSCFWVHNHFLTAIPALSPKKWECKTYLQNATNL